MTARRRSAPKAIGWVLVALGCIATQSREIGARQSPVTVLLDRFDAGERAPVISELAQITDVSAFIKDLDKRAPSWIKARGAEQVHRRRLVAATFALAAAVPRLWPEDVDPLVEWGCELLRKAGPPDNAERAWQRAAVAVFGRARDDGRLVTNSRGGTPAGTRLPPERRRTVDHIAHARLRFPDEQRFRLAQAMFFAIGADTEPARDVEWVPTERLPRNSELAVARARAIESIRRFEPLLSVPELKNEAQLRMGYLRLILHEPDAALDLFAGAAESADPFVLYLAHLLSGRAEDMRSHRDEANARYRAALQVMPRAQSAATALAANLFLADQPDEAYALAATALSGPAPTGDPWNLFGYGDRRLISSLMNSLDKAIR